METAADAMEREEVGGGQDGADDRARIEEKDLRNIVVLRVSQGGTTYEGRRSSVRCSSADEAGGGGARGTLFFHPSLGRRQTNIWEYHVVGGMPLASFSVQYMVLFLLNTTNGKDLVDNVLGSTEVVFTAPNIMSETMAFPTQV